MSTERKTALLAQFARVGKALGNPARLHLLDLLIQAERSVEALAEAAGMPVGNTSAQVRALHAAGLVASRRDGTRVYYRIASSDVAALYRALCELAHTHLPDAQAARAAYLHSDDLDEPVSRAELLRRAEAGDVIVIDVRPTEEYAAAHIPGAVSIPFDLPPSPAPADEVHARSIAGIRQVHQRSTGTGRTESGSVTGYRGPRQPGRRGPPVPG